MLILIVKTSHNHIKTSAAFCKPGCYVQPFWCWHNHRDVTLYGQSQFLCKKIFFLLLVEAMAMCLLTLHQDRTKRGLTFIHATWSVGDIQA